MLVALFSDDDLFECFVLKGGNALALVHEVDDRATVDLDFSMSTAFPEDWNPEEKIGSALERHFRRLGYVVFDCKFKHKPSSPKAETPDWWGGYLFEFKLSDAEKYETLKTDLAAVQRNAIVLGPQQQRTYKIDISKFEFCEGKEDALVDDYTIRVYSLDMIVIEKLRAICQQMPSYPLVANPRARARDFYDIYTVLERRDVVLHNQKHLFEDIFAAKGVPLHLLWDVHTTYDFHEIDWPSVLDATDGQLSFRDCFDYVTQLLDDLKTHWDM